MKEFKKRRETIKKQLASGQALVLTSLPEFYRQVDVAVPYRQDSNFYYLTGYTDPEAVLILTRKTSLLCLPNRRPQREIWDGPRYSPKEAKKVFLMDATEPLEDIDKVLNQHLKGVDTIFYSSSSPNSLPDVSKKIRGLKKKIRDPRLLLAPLRQIKSSLEIEHMKKACLITCKAHKALAKACKPGRSERALHGCFLQSIMEQGSVRESYQSIVATGESATILHYIKNDKVCKRGELLLVDAAAEWSHYASDVTRVYPVSGRFSPIQKKVYNQLLKLQKSLIRSVKPGQDFASLNTSMREGLVEILLDLGILKGQASTHLKKKSFLKYTCHSVGHFLGLDVHDSTFLDKKNQAFKENMVITIEPGLYFSSTDQQVPAGLRGTGLRIEDDLHITKTSCQVLSKSLPKELDQIEELCSL